MKTLFRLVRRGTHYYAHNRNTGQRTSLNTDDQESAEQILNAKNEAERMPVMNLALGRVFLAARDASLPNRTWGDVMERIGRGGKESTRYRYEVAMRDPFIGRLKNRRIIETTSQDLFGIMDAGNRSTTYYLRRLHRFAINLGWLPAPILSPKMWPRIRWNSRRGITREEHGRIIADDPCEERRNYHEVLWFTGASQGDAAQFTASQIDWKTKTLVYRRAKLGEDAPPAFITIGPRLEEVLRRLPTEGFLFPTIAMMTPSQRADRFKIRRDRAGIQNVTLHCYRYAWAERAYEAGMPERYAMAVLGHACETVHRLYARKANVHVPALETYEEQRSKAA